MNNIPKNVSMPTLNILFCFLFLFLTTTYANSKLELEEKPTPIPNSAPAYAPNNPNPELKENPKSPNTKPESKPTPKSSNAPTPKLPNTNPTPESNTKPTPKSKPTPESNSKSHNAPAPKSPNTKPTPDSIPKSPNAPAPKAPKAEANSTSPYQFANHFCLSRRLDVKQTFCLQVLRSSPNSSDATNNLQLLQIAGDMAIQFGNKTLLLLEKMSKDTNTSPNLKPVIEECVSAYKGYSSQYKVLVQEAKNNAQLGSYDAELAQIEINGCVKALTKARDEDIEAQNIIALDYTKLSQNIADSIAP